MYIGTTAKPSVGEIPTPPKEDDLRVFFEASPLGLSLLAHLAESDIGHLCHRRPQLLGYVPSGLTTRLPRYDNPSPTGVGIGSAVIFHLFAFGMVPTGFSEGQKGVYHLYRASFQSLLGGV